MKAIALLLASFLLLCPVSAQEGVPNPKKSEELTRLSFNMFTGGVITIKALFENHPDSLQFIIDTGSGGISLDSATAVALGVTVGEPERTIRGIGAIKKVGMIKNRRLRVGDLDIPNLNFHVLDYTSLSQLYGEKIDGIIGYSMLSRFIVKLNYDQRQMRIYSLGKMRYPRSGIVVKLGFMPLPTAVAEISHARKVRFNYLVDIGAGINALLTQKYTEDSAFLYRRKQPFIKQGEGMGGKINMEQTVVKELKLGKYKFKDVPVNIFTDDYNVMAYPRLGGLIGNDLLRRFNCTINYATGEMHLIPNKSFRDPFDYAYTGIELYWIDDKIIIGEIPPMSPAEKAGVQMGDELFGIDHQLALSMDEAKHLLLTKIGKVRLIIKRDKELMIIPMNVVSILDGR